MNVKLLSYTKLQVCAKAIRTCWESFERSDSTDDICGQVDKNLIIRIGNKEKHASTLEHLTFTFFIEGISRACLQELARHRIASLSVKSTRYTLKELKNDSVFQTLLHPVEVENLKNNMENVFTKYLVFTGNKDVDLASCIALANLGYLVNTGVSNDLVKYCIPEAYKTTLTWTINARALQNFLSLRTTPRALWEIRDLALNIFAALPEDYKYIFEECLYENNNPKED